MRLYSVFCDQVYGKLYLTKAAVKKKENISKGAYGCMDFI